MSFPSSPTVGQQVTEGGRLYQWTGYVWDLVANVSAHASAHATGGSDAITPSSIGAAATSHVHSAADVTSGTLADARLSSNVVLTSDTRLASNGNKGDITVSSNGESWAINANAVVTADIADSAVTDAKIASVAASKLTGTLDDARLSTNAALYSRVVPYFSGTASAIDVFPRGEAYSGGVAVTSGYVRAVFFTPMQTITVSSITMISGTTLASGLTTAQMALYSFDETTATLLARTASDTTLFTATETAYTRSFSASGGYPATYTLQAGTRYGVGAFLVGTTMPTLFGKATAVGGNSITPRTSGLSPLSSTLLTSFTVSANIPIAFARLS